MRPRPDPECPPPWAELADDVDAVPVESVTALWRALNYLCAAQLYLAHNARLEAPLAPEHVKAAPSGHWGVCPPVNLALAVLAPLRRIVRDVEVMVVHGAGHAGPSALAYAYLTGALGRDRPEFLPSPAGLHQLVSGFPHREGLGSEITPMIPGHGYTGGQLGPALAFATGYVLDAPRRLAVALIGDGECESGATAAAWLGMRAFAGSGRHGAVLPVVLLNGLRMGGASLLGGLSEMEQVDYFVGLGFDPIVAGEPTVPAECSPLDSVVPAARAAVDSALRRLRPVGAPGRPPVLLLRLPKGATGPDAVSGRRIIGTPRVHKTPLRDPRTDPVEFAALATWLASYGPHELIEAGGRPTPLVAAALPESGAAPLPAPVGTPPPMPPAEAVSLGMAATAVVSHHAMAGDFRVFSPDELASNQIPLAADDGSPPPWVREVLNEELCHAWLHGYLEGGGRGLLITYEAFAPMNTSLIQQFLKHRAASRTAGRPSRASLNYLLTSLGWNNTFTHQNPGLLASLVQSDDPGIRVWTPADPDRVAAVLDAMLRSQDCLNVMLCDKHARQRFPTWTLDTELSIGAAVWPQFSTVDHPQLVVAAAGDIATRQALAMLALLPVGAAAPRVRFVALAELTCLGDPQARPHALSRDAFEALFPRRVPVLLTVPGYPDVLHNLLWSRAGAADRFTIVGFREPRRPMSPEQLLRHSGLDAGSLYRTAGRLLGAAWPDRARPAPDLPALVPASEFAVRGERP